MPYNKLSSVLRWGLPEYSCFFGPIDGKELPKLIYTKLKLLPFQFFQTPIYYLIPTGYRIKKQT